MHQTLIRKKRYVPLSKVHLLWKMIILLVNALDLTLYHWQIYHRNRKVTAYIWSSKNSEAGGFSKVMFLENM